MSLKRCWQIFVAVIRREWAFILIRKRKFLLFNTVLPLSSFAVMIAIFAVPTLKDIPLAVVDNDNTNISRELIQTVSASPYVEIVKHLPNAKEGERLLANAEIYGMLIIPHDFSEIVMGYKGAAVPLYYNNQFIILGGLVNKGVVSAVKDFSDRYNVLLAESEGTPVYAAAMQASPLLFSDVVLFNPYMNYQYFMLLGLLPAIFQLFVIGAFAYAFGHEFKTGDAAEIAEYAKEAPFTVVAAKGLPYFLIYSALGAVMLLLIFGYIGTPLEKGALWVLLATLLLTTASCTGGLLIIGLSMGNLRMSLSVTAVYAAPAFAYAGITFPYIGMPFFAKLWCDLLPVSYYHKILVNEAIRGATVSGTPHDIIYLFIFTAVTFTVGVFLYRFVMMRPRFWGKL